MRLLTTASWIKKITARRNYDTPLSCDFSGTLYEMVSRALRELCCIIMSNLNITCIVFGCSVFLHLCNEVKVVQSIEIFLHSVFFLMWDALPILISPHLRVQASL